MRGCGRGGDDAARLKEDFMKLSDTQLLILSSASQRTDHAAVPPANLKGGAAKKVLDAGRFQVRLQYSGFVFFKINWTQFGNVESCCGRRGRSRLGRLPPIEIGLKQIISAKYRSDYEANLPDHRHTAQKKPISTHSTIRSRTNE
jgi:hypothetical protein